MRLTCPAAKLLPALGLAVAGLAILPVLAPATAGAAAAAPARASAHAGPATPATVSAPACTSTFEVIGNGVRIRTAPNLSAAVVGLAYKGQRFTGNCYTVQGATYTACTGPAENWWVKLKFDGVWRYSAAACYTPL